MTEHLLDRTEVRPSVEEVRRARMAKGMGVEVGAAGTTVYLPHVIVNSLAVSNTVTLSQTGTVADLYRHFGIDANAIVHAANAAAPGRPVRYLRALPE